MASVWETENGVCNSVFRGRKQSIYTHHAFTVVFNVDDVEDIQWNPEAFDRLDIPGNKKEIVQTLIESHTQKVAAFDDFVPGKGLGLIFALHGQFTCLLLMTERRI